MDINWGILPGQPVQNNGGRNALAYLSEGYQLGNQVRESRKREEEQAKEEEGKKAAAIYAANPSDKNMNALFAYMRPEQIMDVGLKRQAAGVKAQEQKRTGMVDIAKLFESVTPENYANRLQIAQQMGLDISSAPQTYDPQWVASNKAIIDAFVKKEDQLPGLAREIAMVHPPGSPEFNQAFRNALTGKYGTDYADEEGNIRRRSIFDFSSQAGPQPGSVEEGYQFMGGDPGDPNNWQAVDNIGGEYLPIPRLGER